MCGIATRSSFRSPRNITSHSTHSLNFFPPYCGSPEGVKAKANTPISDRIMSNKTYFRCTRTTLITWFTPGRTQAGRGRLTAETRRAQRGSYPQEGAKGCKKEWHVVDGAGTTVVREHAA